MVFRVQLLYSYPPSYVSLNRVDSELLELRVVGRAADLGLGVLYRSEWRRCMICACVHPADEAAGEPSQSARETIRHVHTAHGVWRVLRQKSAVDLCGATDKETSLWQSSVVIMMMERMDAGAPVSSARPPVSSSFRLPPYYNVNDADRIRIRTHSGTYQQSTGH